MSVVMSVADCCEPSRLLICAFKCVSERDGVTDRPCVCVYVCVWLLTRESCRHLASWFPPSKQQCQGKEGKINQAGLETVSDLEVLTPL